MGNSSIWSVSVSKSSALFPHDFFFFLDLLQKIAAAASCASGCIISYSKCLFKGSCFFFFSGNQPGYYCLPFFSSCLQLNRNSTLDRREKQRNLGACMKVLKILLLVANVWEDGPNGLHTHLQRRRSFLTEHQGANYFQKYIFLHFASSLDDNSKDVKGRYFLLLFTDTRDEVF